MEDYNCLLLEESRIEFREEMRELRQYTKSRFSDINSQFDEMTCKLDAIIELLPNWLRSNGIEPVVPSDQVASSLVDDLLEINNSLDVDSVSKHSWIDSESEVHSAKNDGSFYEGICELNESADAVVFDEMTDSIREALLEEQMHTKLDMLVDSTFGEEHVEEQDCYVFGEMFVQNRACNVFDKMSRLNKADFGLKKEYYDSVVTGNVELTEIQEVFAENPEPSIIIQQPFYIEYFNNITLFDPGGDRKFSMGSSVDIISELFRKVHSTCGDGLEGVDCGKIVEKDDSDMVLEEIRHSNYIGIQGAKCVLDENANVVLDPLGLLDVKFQLDLPTESNSFQSGKWDQYCKDVALEIMFGDIVVFMFDPGIDSLFDGRFQSILDELYVYDLGIDANEDQLDINEGQMNVKYIRAALLEEQVVDLSAQEDDLFKLLIFYPRGDIKYAYGLSEGNFRLTAKRDEHNEEEKLKDMEFISLIASQGISQTNGYHKDDVMFKFDPGGCCLFYKSFKVFELNHCCLNERMQSWTTIIVSHRWAVNECLLVSRVALHNIDVTNSLSIILVVVETEVSFILYDEVYFVCTTYDQAAPRIKKRHDIGAGNANIHFTVADMLNRRGPFEDEHFLTDFSHFRLLKSDNHAILPLKSVSIAHGDSSSKSATSKSLSKFFCYCILPSFGPWFGLLSPLRVDFAWDPGIRAIFVYILEDKDAFKSVGKWIILIGHRTELLVTRPNRGFAQIEYLHMLGSTSKDRVELLRMFSTQRVCPECSQQPVWSQESSKMTAWSNVLSYIQNSVKIGLEQIGYYVNDFLWVSRLHFNKALIWRFEIMCYNFVMDWSSVEPHGTFCSKILENGGRKGVCIEATNGVIKNSIKLFVGICSKQGNVQFMIKIMGVCYNIWNLIVCSCYNKSVDSLHICFLSVGEFNHVPATPNFNSHVNQKYIGMIEYKNINECNVSFAIATCLGDSLSFLLDCSRDPVLVIISFYFNEARLHVRIGNYKMLKSLMDSSLATFLLLELSCGDVAYTNVVQDAAMLKIFIWDPGVVISPP